MHTTASGTPAHTPNSPRFTPGPWHEHSHRQIGPEAGIVCEVWAAIGWGDEAIQQAEANVRLIAAAPDLFAALQSALVVVAGCNADGAFDQEEQSIRGALRVAQEGRQ